jgi:hypothetical protein
MKESLTVTWTVEKNENGVWCLFARIGEQMVQMSPWFDTKEELLQYLFDNFSIRKE